MSAAAEPALPEARSARPSDRGALVAVGRALGWIGERLDPILVKEARQSLKSRQFFITFGLLLVCGWVWSFLGLALMGPEASYTGKGPEMFLGYMVILAFPLLVIVPFWAFRSLASEQEDRTYELLSITALTPRQIVSGKLASAVVQMVIYLSAISPCLAFTYMLRGIAFPTIAVLLAYLVLGSLGLSLVGLLVGTLTSEKHWQVVLSVLLIVGLLIAFGMAWGLCATVIWEEELPVDQPEFWQFNAALATAYATYFALVFFAAVAQVTFTSDNRSTRLRIVMLVQHVALVGWTIWMVVAYDPPAEIFFTLLAFLGLHWYVMGAFMTGESPGLSPRVKRGLPQSFLGRVFFTWFNPGPGTGYVFAVSGALAAVVLVGIVVLLREGYGMPILVQFWSPGDSERLLIFGVLALAYLTAYLGVGLLLIRVLHRFGHVVLFLGVLIQVLLVLGGCAVPAVLETLSPGYSMEYSLLHITNPFWTLFRVATDSILPAQTATLLIAVPVAGLAVFVMNLPGVVREVREVRIAKPERVAEEDAELAAQKSPPQPIRTSPWDVVEPSAGPRP
jgi:ABC-type transport system involved in multi-copper enzyme maturation permease subunit